MYGKIDKYVFTFRYVRGSDVEVYGKIDSWSEDLLDTFSSTRTNCKIMSQTDNKDQQNQWNVCVHILRGEVEVYGKIELHKLVWRFVTKISNNQMKL